MPTSGTKHAAASTSDITITDMMDSDGEPLRLKRSRLICNHLKGDGNLCENNATSFGPNLCGVHAPKDPNITLNKVHPDVTSLRETTRARASSSARANGGVQEDDSTTTTTTTPAIPNTDTNTELGTTTAGSGGQGFSHAAFAAVARAMDQQGADRLSRPNMAVVLFPEMVTLAEETTFSNTRSLLAFPFVASLAGGHPQWGPAHPLWSAAWNLISTSRVPVGPIMNVQGFTYPFDRKVTRAPIHLPVSAITRPPPQPRCPNPVAQFQFLLAATFGSTADGAWVTAPLPRSWFQSRTAVFVLPWHSELRARLGISHTRLVCSLGNSPLPRSWFQTRTAVCVLP